jgi:hypothetical protein
MNWSKKKLENMLPNTMDTNNLFQLFQPYGKVIGVDQFQNRLLHNKFTIVVFYRGNWYVDYE